MKRKQFKQSVKGAVSSVVIMPTFGNISFTVRGKFDLPFEIFRYRDDEGNLELPVELMARAIKKRDKIAKEIQKETGYIAELWLKSKKFKDKQIPHLFYIDSKVNKSFYSNKKRKADGVLNV